MKLYYCYEFLNKKNNKRYIGISYNPTQRYKQHIKVSKNGSLPLYNSINKYGIENFEFNIIDKNISQKEILLLEIDYIKKYNTTNRNYGYNISIGGGGGNGVKRSKKTKKLISKKMKKVAADSKWRKNNSESKIEHFKNPKNREISRQSAIKQCKEGKNKGLELLFQYHEENPNAHYNNAMIQAKKCSYNGIIYESVAEASRKNNIPETSMRRKITIL